MQKLPDPLSLGRSRLTSGLLPREGRAGWGVGRRSRSSPWPPCQRRSAAACWPQVCVSETAEFETTVRIPQQRLPPPTHPSPTHSSTQPHQYGNFLCQAQCQDPAGPLLSKNTASVESAGLQNPGWDQTGPLALLGISARVEVGTQKALPAGRQMEIPVWGKGSRESGQDRQGAPRQPTVQAESMNGDS